MKKNTPVISLDFGDFVNGITFAYTEELEITNDEMRNIIFKARENKKLFSNIKKPYTLISKFVESNSLAYALFIINGKDRHILSSSDKDIVENCIESLNNNKYIQNEIFKPYDKDFQVYKEIGALFKFPVKVDNNIVTIKGKALLDILQYNYETNTILINDLKTTAKSINQMSPNKDRNTLGTIWSYRYYRQLAWYRFAIESLYRGLGVFIDSEGDKIEIKFNKSKPLKVYTKIVAVETIGEFQSGIIPINTKWVEKGVKEFESIVDRLAWHTHHDNWDEQMEFNLNSGCITMENP